MEIIPLESEPNQQVLVILGNQECTIAVYSRGGYLFMDLMVGSTPVFAGAICNHGANIVPFATELFKGSLHFYDTEGHSRPVWDKLKERFMLLYLDEGESLPEELAY